MTALLETVELALLAFALFTSVGAAFAALAYPRLRLRIARIRPATRADILLAVAAAPLLVGIVLTVVSFLPGEFGSGGFVDHCDDHPGHVHLCLMHRPPLDQGVVGWAIVAGLAGLAVIALARQARRLLRSSIAIDGLRRMARSRLDGGGVRVIDSPVPLAATAGLLRPAVYLSSGFLAGVDADAIRVVGAHEREHVRRRDPLRQVLATLFALAHVPGTRRQLLADHELAAEQACDEAAAFAVGDRVRVARAVLAVERLMSRVQVDPHLVAASFGGSHVAARVGTMLSDGRWSAAWDRRIVFASAVVGLTVLLLSAGSLHHATETLLNWLTR